jgi:phosphotriesterase-related protein
LVQRRKNAMSSSNPMLAGKVQTVLGPIANAEMGITLSHEHCLIDITCTAKRPVDERERQRASEPLSFKNVGYARYHPLDIRDNLLMLDEELAITELREFTEAGGKTLVDMTNDDLKRNPQALVRIAKATGLHIIMGSGYYEGAAQDAGKMEKRNEEDIAAEIVADIRDGVHGTEIRAGLIGEIGCSWPLKELERKSLRAAGMAQKETGAPLVVHPGRNEKAPEELVTILREVGADLGHTVICHIDRTVFEAENRYRLAEAGCFLAYDIWGTEGHYPSEFSITDILNDTQRIAAIKDLTTKGYGRQMLISHDICWKCRYSTFGGHGYAHILRNVLPLMTIRGVSDSDIKNLLVRNPSRFFAFGSVA